MKGILLSAKDVKTLLNPIDPTDMRSITLFREEDKSGLVTQN